MQLGVGEATVNQHGTNPDSEFLGETPAGITAHSQYFEPGLGVIVKPWGPLLVGADATVPVLLAAPSSTTCGFALQAQLGLAF